MDYKAIEQYHKHLERLRKYNANHKEELNNLAKEYYKNKIKTDPEKYKAYLEKRREYQKQKRLEKKQKQKSLEEINNILKD